MRSFTLALIAALLIGCQSSPSMDEVDVSDFGPRPLDAESIARRYIQSTFKEPSSVKGFAMSAHEALAGYAAYSAGGLRKRFEYGWVIDFVANAKNSYGGYTGRQAHQLLYRNGAVISAERKGDQLDLIHYVGSEEVTHDRKKLEALFGHLR